MSPRYAEEDDAGDDDALEKEIGEDEEPAEYDRTEDYDDNEAEDGGYGAGKGYSREKPEEIGERGCFFKGLIWLAVLAMLAMVWAGLRGW